MRTIEKLNMNVWYGIARETKIYTKQLIQFKAQFEFVGC